MTLSFETIARLIEAPPAKGPDISGWSIDSRTIARGDCFFALRGPAHDGHDYVANVFERGASLAIVEKECGAGGPQFLVPDTTVALQALATAMRWPARLQLSTEETYLGSSALRSRVSYQL